MPITRTVRVTIEAEYKIELPDEMGTPEAIEGWNKALWDIDGVDDIACHAAEMVAKGFAGSNLDGLGVLDGYNVTYPQVPDTKFTEIDFYIDSEVIEGEADKS